MMTQATLKRSIRQLIPHTVRTRYFTHVEGQEMFCVWKMWLGRCYKIDRIPVKGAS